ncbi:hypothetical protein Tco_0893222 [Tanacetum coccineum]|uniref:Integrase, catalytic region, zinc finger, CCHC-type, peptidase aspartic, catalytic n=1 Tax=Tanacetum coccineum TaxID=301880 RepID=A0ABQ5C8P6_9ASTR
MIMSQAGLDNYLLASGFCKTKTDFASWQQRIRLYCQGKENGVNILNSIDEGPFQMGTFRETLSEGNEGALHLCNTPKFTTQWNSTLGCYFIIQAHESR